MSKPLLTDMQRVAVDQMSDIIGRMKFAIKEASDSIKLLRAGASTYEDFCESDEYTHLISLCTEMSEVGEEFSELEFDEEIDDND